MLARTHVVFSILTGIVLTKFISTGNIYLFYLFIVIGALLPDMDCPKSKAGQSIGFISKFIEKIFGHRGLFHTLWAAIIIPGIFYYFINKTYGLALFIGYLSHLVADGFTIKGINYLHPLLDLRMSGFVETGRASETVVFIGIIALVAWSFLF